MLYPDLRRLAIVCPTGMPLPSGTHNHEAGGSNDPLPPPPSRARPGEGDEAPPTAQSEALGKKATPRQRHAFSSTPRCSRCT